MRIYFDEVLAVEERLGDEVTVGDGADAGEIEVAEEFVTGGEGELGLACGEDFCEVYARAESDVDV